MVALDGELTAVAVVALQRVWSGAHWPSDVLAAYLWGGVILFFLVKAYEFCGCCQFQTLISSLHSPS